MEESTKNAARQLIAQLARNASAGSALEEMDESVLQSGLAKLAIAQIALNYPVASIGTCGADGSTLRFEGREDGLYVCCTGDETHSWKIS